MRFEQPKYSHPSTTGLAQRFSARIEIVSTGKTDFFETTHWSVVLGSIPGNEEQGSRALGALNELCRIYWRPLYAYLRRAGRSAEDAEDLTQQFLSELLQRDAFSKLHPSKGKFRSFLIVSLKNFLSHERDKALAQKRGGGALPIPLDDLVLERGLSEERDLNRTPEEEYERLWALTVLEQVRKRLRGEYAAMSKDCLFEYLGQFLPGSEPEQSQQEIGERLGITASAVKSEVYRLRQRFGQYLRVEIGRTVGSAAEIDQEIEYLIQVVGRSS
jgi:RNA polymerase sigma factor (sigma-70 family)